jgi:hypothetical protein
MKSRLSEVADVARKELEVKSIYQFNGQNGYSARHPNALAEIGSPDDPANIKGKGIEGEIGADGAGGHYDIYGNGLDSASGRVGNLVKNKFTRDQPYPYTNIE